LPVFKINQWPKPINSPVRQKGYQMISY